MSNRINDWDLLPHQYAKRQLKDVEFSDLFGTSLVDGGPRLSFKYHIIDEILNKNKDINFQHHFNRNQSLIRKYKNLLAMYALQFKMEHGKIVYSAIKKGIKVKTKVLNALPELNDWAKEYNWDSTLIDLKISTNHGGKITKPVPTRDDPEDNLREKFDKKDKENQRW